MIEHSVLGCDRRAMNAITRDVLNALLISDPDLADVERTVVRQLITRTEPTAPRREAAAPARAASAGSNAPEWLRLPAPGRRCPFTGLSRSTLNELTISGQANNNRPPVKSVVLRKRGALRGIRLISYDSLMAYLESMAERPTDESPAL